MGKNYNLDAKSDALAFELFGDQALISDPVTRIGGEKESYPVPTYGMLQGVCESIYWKPTFKWVVDSVRVLNEVSYESNGVKLIHYNSDKANLSSYMYLTNVHYLVKAHMIFNRDKMYLANDYDLRKHTDIFQRAVSRGGRRPIFLGVSECYGFVKPLDVNNFYDEGGFYDNVHEYPLGKMYHSLTYNKAGAVVKMNYWHPVMRDGVINFVTPERCPIRIPIEYKGSNSGTPLFKGNGRTYKSVDQEYKEMDLDGGETK